MKTLNATLAVIIPVVLSGLFFLPNKGILLTVLLGYLYWRGVLKPAYTKWFNYLTSK